MKSNVSIYFKRNRKERDDILKRKEEEREGEREGKKEGR